MGVGTDWCRDVSLPQLQVCGTSVIEFDYLPYNNGQSCVREIHINGDVVLFASQFLAMTDDREWLKTFFPFADAVASFWISRSACNSDGSFSIRDVVPPDVSSRGCIADSFEDRRDAFDD